MKNALVGVRLMMGLSVLVLAFAGSGAKPTDGASIQAPVAGRTCSGAVMKAGVAYISQSPCEKCTDNCKARTDECKDGSVKACYLAAACLCQCNLDAGGCGSDKEALQKCVRDNEKNARELGN
jgi:hypothetical protein